MFERNLMKSLGFIQRLTKGLLYLRPKSWRSLQPLQLLAIREKSLFLSRLETIVLYAFRKWLWMCPIYDMPPSGSSLSVCLIIAYGFNICKKSPGRHDCRDCSLSKKSVFHAIPVDSAGQRLPLEGKLAAQPTDEESGSLRGSPHTGGKAVLLP